MNNFKFNSHVTFLNQKHIYVLKMLCVGLFVVILGIHVGNIMFGKSSIEVLNSLKYDKEKLQIAIIKLKNDNAALQKEYFELRQLDPDTKTEK